MPDCAARSFIRAAIPDQTKDGARPSKDERRRQLQHLSSDWHDGAIMSARTQITMDPELQRRAHTKAAELGLSFAEYVRRLVAHDLGEPRRNTSISLLFDLGVSSEPTDIAGDNDRMLAEAAWAEHVRTTARKAARRVGAPGPVRHVVERLRRYLGLVRSRQRPRSAKCTREVADSRGRPNLNRSVQPFLHSKRA
jgi:hypothetical protein